MSSQILILVLACILLCHTSHAFTCQQDSDCRGLEGGICSNEECSCPQGLEAILGATLCGETAPYYLSSCVEVHQCSRLITGYQCEVSDSQNGICNCQPGFHYFQGRCWHSVGYGQACFRDEECLDTLRDPFSLRCDGTCVCADGYYRRQQGECRKSSLAVGESCVIDEDCQFAGGACNHTDFSCYNLNANNAPNSIRDSEVDIKITSIHNEITILLANATFSNTVMRNHGVLCSAINPCEEPFECSNHGICICPRGYYYEGNMCMAELGSPSTVEQCANGLFKEVRDGICTCQTNFYYADNMRDCVKATIWLSHACVIDANCHTFGVATLCGAPREPWGLRSCECNPEQAVWDPERAMCRLIAGIGGSCTTDAECLAGDMPIQCVSGLCTCPPGFTDVDGLCLTSGLALGDSCQATQECNATSNTICHDRRCSCSETYIEVNGRCEPGISGVCTSNSDCFVQNSVCYNNGSEYSVCQCGDGFLEYADECWPVVPGFNAECNITAQCVQAMGDASSCDNGFCVCADGYHYRDNSCWRATGLFETCSRTSECYLSEISDRVVCRNSICQCDFDFPYDEALHTCRSSAASIFGNIFLLLAALIYLSS